MVEIELSRRTYLIIKKTETPGGYSSSALPSLVAASAVDTMAAEHPEWDMEETRTWAEWEADEQLSHR